MSETKQEKWDRGKTLMLESLHKPDDRLRGCAHNQECFHELLEIRDEVLEIVTNMPNPHSPPLAFGKKNSHIEPTINTLSCLHNNHLMLHSLEFHLSHHEE